MTAQTAEIHLLDDRAESLHSRPLDSYLDARGIDMREISPSYSSALWRRYVGVWELFGSDLYLTGLFNSENEPID